MTKLWKRANFRFLKNSHYLGILMNRDHGKGSRNREVQLGCSSRLWQRTLAIAKHNMNCLSHSWSKLCNCEEQIKYTSQMQTPRSRTWRRTMTQDINKFNKSQNHETEHRYSFRIPHTQTIYTSIPNSTF